VLSFVKDYNKIKKNVSRTYYFAFKHVINYPTSRILRITRDDLLFVNANTEDDT